MPLINTKLCIQLNYTKHSVISSGFDDPADNEDVNSSTFKIPKTELYVPVVTLNTEHNDKLNQLLLEIESDSSITIPKNKFKRTAYWDEYKSIIEDVVQPHNNNNYKRIL